MARKTATEYQIRYALEFGNEKLSDQLTFVLNEIAIRVDATSLFPNVLTVGVAQQIADVVGETNTVPEYLVPASKSQERRFELQVASPHGQEEGESAETPAAGEPNMLIPAGQVEAAPLAPPVGGGDDESIPSAPVS